MREDYKLHIRDVREIRWIENGWPEPDGDGVIIHSISGGVHYRARCSWHQFIRYHQESAKLIKEHMASNSVRYFAPDCGGCEDVP